MRFGTLVTRLTSFIFLGCILTGVPARLSAQTSSLASTDETALRLLAERFYHSMESTDRTEFLSLWSSRSTDDESKRSKQEMGYDKVRVESLAIRGVEASGDTAKVHVKVHMSAVWKRTGKPIRGYFGRDFFATLRCVMEAGAWKVLEHVSTVDDLAALIGRASTSEERTALLAKNQELISRELASALFDKASYLESDDFEKSLAIYRLAMQIATQVGDKLQLTELMAAVGSYFDRRGDLAQSLEYYLKSLEVSEGLGPEERSRKNYVHANIGIIYAEQGNYTQALEWYQRGLNPSNPQAWVLSNIADAYQNLGDYQKALEYYNESLQKAGHLEPNSGRDGAVAGSLAGIGSVYVAQGNYSQALEYYDKALWLAEASQNLGTEGLIPELLNSLAKLYLLQGNPARAVELIERAMATPRAQTGAPGADVVILQTAGRAYRAAGLRDRARQVLNKAIAGSEYRRSNAAGGEQGRQLYFEQLITPYHEMIKLLIEEKSDEDAFNYAERSKARALLNLLQSARVEINKALTSEEKERDGELRRKISILNQELEIAKQEPQADPTRIAALGTNVEKARLEYEAFETKVYAAHPELRVARGDLKPITLPETREFLPDSNTVVLEYVVTDERTYLFVLTKADTQSQPALKVYPLEIKQRDLADDVERYREKLAKRDPDFLQAASKLFTLLLGPAQAQLQNKSLMLIVPDGVLWDLPFQALQSSEQHFLIEKHIVSYAPSLTALREMLREGSKRSGSAAVRIDLLALGNPVIGRKVLQRAKTGLMDENLEPLPEAEKQIVSLGRLYGPAKSKVYTGGAATEDRAKADAPKFRIIQFATHGILNSRSPMYSHLVLSTSGKDEDEDGLLEAWEIMKLDLHADMVVLAACETARGRIRAGEGVIGMSWAFFVAGSPTTVASQWKVDSASTTQLMLEFHRNLKRGMESSNVHMSKAKALQLASLKLLKSRNYRHPFYWAGFVLIGDGF